jgi:hypothetical protein
MRIVAPNPAQKNYPMDPRIKKHALNTVGPEPSFIRGLQVKLRKQLFGRHPQVSSQEI